MPAVEHPGGAFDGTVDFVIIEAFINKASVAGDSCVGGPAVDVAMLLEREVLE